jgi:hypothetical protein
MFARLADLGKEFGAGLLSLQFEDCELLRWVHEYVVF